MTQWLRAGGVRCVIVDLSLPDARGLEAASPSERRSWSTVSADLPAGGHQPVVDD